MALVSMKLWHCTSSFNDLEGRVEKREKREGGVVVSAGDPLHDPLQIPILVENEIHERASQNLPDMTGSRVTRRHFWFSTAFWTLPGASSCI